MKKLFLILSVALFALGTVNAFAQEAAAAAEETVTAVAETQLAGESMHHILMQKFLEGGWGWMLPVLLCLVIGLSVAID
ncbi:MAG: MotA/TolQ/ExbB proton channel family protein, partial [Alistipes sp.]|nr:MotA/TolQ/ExbB proton channel family protein [Alistipes sp.]